MIEKMFEELEKEDFGFELGKDFIVDEIIFRNSKGEVVHLNLKEMEK